MEGPFGYAINVLTVIDTVLAYINIMYLLIFVILFLNIVAIEEYRIM